MSDAEGEWVWRRSGGEGAEMGGVDRQVEEDEGTERGARGLQHRMDALESMPARAPEKEGEGVEEQGMEQGHGEGRGPLAGGEYTDLS